MPGASRRGEEVSIVSPGEETLEVLQDRATHHLETAANVRHILEEQPGDVDKNIAEFVDATNDYALHDGTVEAKDEAIIADEVAIVAMDGGHNVAVLAAALEQQPLEPLGDALQEIAAVKGDDAVNQVIEAIEDAENLGLEREESGSTDTYRKLLNIDPRNNFTVRVIPGEDNDRASMLTHLTPAIERKLGTSNPEEIALMECDTTERFTVPNTERVGEAIEIHNEVRRPIMDISIEDEAARAAVKEALEKRLVGFETVFKELSETQGKTAEERRTILHEITDPRDGLLVRSGVWSRRYGDRLSSEGNGNLFGRPRGTVADLYIDPSDIEQYEVLDERLNALAGEVAPHLGLTPYDSLSELTERVASVAELTFPSGVELMHRTKWESFGRILSQGQLATRGMMLHFADNSKRGLNLNGAFVHFTPPGTSAEEYGDVLIGVPIDTIVRHSPRLQLEAEYIRNIFQRDGKDYATQEVMGAFTINQPDEERVTPLVFRKALQALQDTIAKGANRLDIKQGSVDNLSFAASNDKQTASSYLYPLTEIHAYTDNPSKVDEMAATYPELSQKLYSVTSSIVGVTREVEDLRGVKYTHAPLREVNLPNFSVRNGSLKVYAPIYAEEVPFTEAVMAATHAGSQLDFSLETTVAESLPRLSGRLVNDADEDPEAVFARMMNVVNAKKLNVSPVDALQGYLEGRERFQDKGITIENLAKTIALPKALMLVKAMPDQSLSESEFKAWNQLGITPEDARELTQVVGDRLFEDDRANFVRNYAMLQSRGYKISAAQELLYRQYEQNEASARVQVAEAHSEPYGLI